MKILSINITMIIDADSHFTPKFEIESGPTQNWTADYLKRKQDQFSDIELRVQELQNLKIDRQLLNPMGPSLGLNYSLDPVTSAAVMTMYNDYMWKICQKYPQFDWNLWAALQDIDATVKEIENRLDQSFFGVYVDDIIPYGFVDSMEPMWQLISKYNIPWYMHFHDGGMVLKPDQDWSTTYHNLFVEFSSKPWMISISSLIIGGVFDRYSNLKIVIAERDIDWINDLRLAFDKLGYQDPLPILQNNFWFTIEPEMKNFVDHADTIGWNQLLFATDWPHDFDIGGSNSLNDVDTVLNLPINHLHQRKIFSDNYMVLKR
jgi:predicted TIM-barrel fold metal-dependent hydrolase